MFLRYMWKKNFFPQSHAEEIMLSSIHYILITLNNFIEFVFKISSTTRLWSTVCYITLIIVYYNFKVIPSISRAPTAKKSLDLLNQIIIRFYCISS